MTTEGKVYHYVELAQRHGAETVIRFLVDLIADLYAELDVKP
ncbi:MAG TPA: hypothetical protein VMY42_08175 [Thermoguttaceae bacterium]|nr:hypothetical protein [Thermoguttaceae bacterium]